MNNPYNSRQFNNMNPYQQKSTDGFAITSMVLGILAVLSCYFGIILGTIAVIFGHVSLSKMKKNPGLQGKGMAIAGLVCGYIGILVTIGFGALVYSTKDTFTEAIEMQLQEQMEAELQKQEEGIVNPVE